MVDYKRALIRDGKRKMMLRDFSELVDTQYKGKYGPYRGQKQDILTTIEFGYAPFVPMSEQYIMNERGMGDGYSISPDDLPSNQLWMDNLESWAQNRGQNFEWSDTKTQRLPQTQIKSEAERVSAELSYMLSQDIGSKEVTKKYASEHRAEIEDEAFVTYLMKKNPGYLFDVNPELPRYKRDSTDSINRISDQGIDVANKDANSRESTLAIINMIASKGEHDNIEQIGRSFETTSMSWEKWYQVTFNALRKSIDNTQDAWRTTIELMVETIKGKWDIIGKDLNTLFEETKTSGKTATGPAKSTFRNFYTTAELKNLGLTQDLEGPILDAIRIMKAGGKIDKETGKPKGVAGPTGDSIEYTMHQMISRFVDIQAHDELGGVMTVMAPIGTQHAGIATLRPHFSSLIGIGGYGAHTLTDITIEFTTVMGGPHAS